MTYNLTYRTFFTCWLLENNLGRHGINSLLESHDEVRKVYKESVGQIVQIAKLTLKSSLIDQTVPKQNNIVVANTHLFYHPMAGEFH